MLFLFLINQVYATYKKYLWKILDFFIQILDFYVFLCYNNLKYELMNNF